MIAVDQGLLYCKAHGLPTLPGFHALLILLERLAVALLGGLIRRVKVRERLPALAQELALSAQAVNVLSGQLVGVGEPL